MASPALIRIQRRLAHYLWRRTEPPHDQDQQPTLPAPAADTTSVPSAPPGFELADSGYESLAVPLPLAPWEKTRSVWVEPLSWLYGGLLVVGALILTWDYPDVAAILVVTSFIWAMLAGTGLGCITLWLYDKLRKRIWNWRWHRAEATSAARGL